MDQALPLAAGPAGYQTLGVPITRRHLIQAGGAAAVALALGEAISFVPHAKPPLGSPGLRRSDYQRHIGQSFGLSAPGASALSIPLVAVNDVSSPRSLAGSEDAFTLIFHAPAGALALGQAVMTVRHPDGWSQRLLVSPASPADHGLDYAAVINRAHPRSS